MQILKGDILSTNSHGDVRVIGAAEEDDLVVVTTNLTADVNDDNEDMVTINRNLQVVYNYSEIERTGNA